jgi:2-dehydro-3-deoxyphosphogluconate aldolase / (4S)-4-hydroxy-2-oxoglutarate aldolase
MDEILKRIGELGIVPVVKIEDAKDAVPLVEALKEGGLPIAEITFRTASAEQAIKNIKKTYPDMFVGAGTVLNVEQVKRAVGAGAAFIVSPGFNPSVVKYCVDNEIPVTPGVSIPSDIEMALGFNLEVVKFFPAEAFGGISALKAMSAPYGMVKFIPTGGINPENLNSYLSFEKVFACGGSWMVKSDLIKSGRFDEITRRTREAVNIMLGFELAHIGINSENSQTSMEIANRFANIFDMPLKKGNSSNFAGTGIEVNKAQGYGKNGHIGIGTNNITRAIAYLERNGVEVDMSTAKGQEGKPPVAVYLKEEIGGFGVHLLQKKV